MHANPTVHITGVFICFGYHCRREHDKHQLQRQILMKKAAFLNKFIAAATTDKAIYHKEKKDKRDTTQEVALGNPTYGCLPHQASCMSSAPSEVQEGHCDF